MGECKICLTTIDEGEFCSSHQIAEKNLQKRFKAWQKAYGDLEWKEYLEKLTTDDEIPIGDWVEEVAEYLLEKELKGK
jgi:hypothetical protein